MKKTYYFKIKSKKKSTKGGFNVVATIYQVKNGKIVELGDTKWQTGSFKGQTSAVYEFLYSNKLVTKKEYTDNKGYFTASKSKVKIEEI